MRKKMWGPVVCVVAVVMLAAACGGRSKGGAKPASPPTSSGTLSWGAGGTHAQLLAAVDRTSEQKTAKLSAKFEIASGGGTLTMTGDGAIDFATHATEVRFARRGGGEDVAAEVRAVDGKVFEKTGGTDWQENDLTTDEGAQQSTMDPGEYFTYLKAISDDAHVVGTEDVRGAETTHFVATADVARAASATQIDADQRAALARALKLLGGKAPAIPLNVWIDNDGHIRKIETTMKISDASAFGSTGTNGVSVNYSMELYEFGTPVDIQAPANVASAQQRAQDRATQSDLRNALTAEKVIYTDDQAYSNDQDTLASTEGSLDWGRTLKYFVGNVNSDAKQIVCVQEQSKSGVTFSLADVASGPNAGTYYGTSACPSPLTAKGAAALGSSWAVTTVVTSW